MDRAEALLLMEKRIAESLDRDPALVYQYETLLNFPETEPLAQVQELKDYPRANIMLAAGKGVHRRQSLAVTPFFYPATLTAPVPGIVPISPLEQKRVRGRRADIAVELKPFLPAIRMHRYLPGPRRRSARATATQPAE